MSLSKSRQQQIESRALARLNHCFSWSMGINGNTEISGCYPTREELTGKIRAILADNNGEYGKLPLHRKTYIRGVIDTWMRRFDYELTHWRVYLDGSLVLGSTVQGDNLRRIDSAHSHQVWNDAPTKIYY